ncbi:lantibiotic dehydratase [Marinitenerispora sediminis]|uniref:Lantibiotic dehydratase n=1 Tax=Marinitenerispora sediminis TaxID=1931232 RepID=A0A368TAE9_9ACTN|nr:lantibiotic dehydratase [Marinitenerispora sediminis]RCV53977.1 lantibiotic dehydratase [Marinitenerispora sediminis]RCV60472.1 lantibiotic dehydratase [Marinitenerispora sediminis]RCV61847.1 lantibiotic dehydratase [Marinitenerispora sediminis]
MTEPTPSLTWTLAAGDRRLRVELLPWLLVRTPGFPAALLDPVARPETLAEADRLADAEARVDRMRAAFLDGTWPTVRERAKTAPPPDAPRFRVLVAAAKRVDRGESVPDRPREALAHYLPDDWAAGWNAAVQARDEAVAAAQATFAGGLAAARGEVAAAFHDTRLRHAVHISNPGFHRTAFGAESTVARLADPRGRDARRALSTAHRYLRRFTTRCETVAFFGPVLFARFAPDLDAPHTVDAPVAERVFVEAGTWLVDRIAADLTQATPVERLRAWRDPMVRPVPGRDEVERVLDGRRVRLPPDLMRFWRAADGRPVAEIAAEAGLAPERIATEVPRLRPLLRLTAVPVPATELHPLPLLAAAPVARRLLAVRDRYADLPWPDRRDALEEAESLAASLSGDRARTAGRHYADREVFHEDRSSPLSERVRFGAPALRGVRAALDAVLPLVYLGALLRREDARDAVRAALSDRPAPLLRVVTADLPEHPRRAERLRAALRALVAERAASPGCRAVHLDSAAVAAVLAPLWELVPPDAAGDPCLPSPDLMAVGPDLATATWLLSELHDDCGSIYGGLENPLHSDPAGLWAGYTAAVTARIDPAGVATVVARRRSAHVTPEPPGRSIELSGMSGRDRAETVPIAEVLVPPTGDRVLVDGRPRLLYPGDLDSTAHRALALPALKPVTVDLGAHTPRITVDGVVYQRERWRIRSQTREAGDEFGRWRAVQRLRSAHALPRRCYVRHPAEPKPLYVDFADPLAVLDLARLPPGEVTVTEALPAPGELWWRVGGAAQHAELRIGCVVSDATVPAQNGGRRP